MSIEEIGGGPALSGPLNVGNVSFGAGASLSLVQFAVDRLTAALAAKEAETKWQPSSDEQWDDLDAAAIALDEALNTIGDQEKGDRRIVEIIVDNELKLREMVEFVLKASTAAAAGERRAAVLASPIPDEGIATTAMPSCDQQKLICPAATWASAEIDRLTVENWQLKGELGYSVPGHIPPGPFKCGLCEARDIKNADLKRERDYWEKIGREKLDDQLVNGLRRDAALAAMQENLNGRDDFIVKRGLWAEFVAGLRSQRHEPSRPDQRTACGEQNDPHRI